LRSRWIGAFERRATAQMLLAATPKDQVDLNSYKLFEPERSVPAE
jgi:type I site-specific restriction endonuclease